MADFQDFDEAVELLDTSIQRTLSGIEQHHDKRSNSSEGLIVLDGENHYSPFAMVSHMAVLSSLNDAGYNVVCGQELPHNNVFFQFRSNASRLGYNSPTDAGLTGQESTFSDPDTSLALKAEIMDYGTDPDIDFAIGTYWALYEYLLRSDFGTDFVDCGRLRTPDDFVIDTTDPLTYETAVSLGYDPSEVMSCYSAPGMHIRNAVMAHLIGETMDHEKSDIYFMPLGNSHVAGQVPNASRSEVWEYQKSMSGILLPTERNTLVIPMPYPNDPEFKYIPEGHGLNDKNSIFDRDLPQAIFRREQFESGIETQVLDALLPHYGLDPTLTDYEDYRTKHTSEVEALFSQWSSDLGLNRSHVPADNPQND